MNAFFTPLNTYFSQQGEDIFIYHNFMNRSTYFPFQKPFNKNKSDLFLFSPI